MTYFNLISFDKAMVPSIHTFYKAFSPNVDILGSNAIPKICNYLTKLGRNGGLP